MFLKTDTAVWDCQNYCFLCYMQISLQLPAYMLLLKSHRWRRDSYGKRDFLLQYVSPDVSISTEMRNTVSLTLLSATSSSLKSLLYLMAPPQEEFPWNARGNSCAIYKAAKLDLGNKEEKHYLSRTGAGRAIPASLSHRNLGRSHILTGMLTSLGCGGAAMGCTVSLGLEWVPCMASRGAIKQIPQRFLGRKCH